MSCRDFGYRVSEESFWKFGNGKLLKKLYIKMTESSSRTLQEFCWSSLRFSRVRLLGV